MTEERAPIEYGVVVRNNDSYAAAMMLRKKVDKMGIEYVQDDQVMLAGLFQFGWPVFIRGEIMFLHDGREINGQQRKPSKWPVDVYYTTDLEEAIFKARVLTMTDETKDLHRKEAMTCLRCRRWYFIHVMKNRLCTACQNEDES